MSYAVDLTNLQNTTEYEHFYANPMNETSIFREDNPNSTFYEGFAAVVPTMSTRTEFLRMSLLSLRRSGVGNIVLVATVNATVDSFITEGLADFCIPDRGNGLAAAINDGVNSLPKNIQYISWISDDDVVIPKGIQEGIAELKKNPKVVLVYGKCRYIDTQDQTVWMNRSGQWASSIIGFGPCLIPQPGSIFRKDSFLQIGGLSENLGWAFDLDLYIRLKTVGKLRFINTEIGMFRWHSKSLTVFRRKESVSEASCVRRSHLPRFLQRISTVWEMPIRIATFHARHLVRISDARN